MEQAWDEAEPETQFVITRYRDKNTNLRTQLQRIIAKAAQNAAQSVRAEGSLALQGKSHQVKKSLELQGSATLRDPLQSQCVGDTGFEPVTSAV